MTNVNPLPAPDGLPQQWAAVIILLLTLLFQVLQSHGIVIPHVPGWLQTLVDFIGGGGAVATHVLAVPQHRAKVIAWAKANRFMLAWFLPFVLSGFLLGGCSSLTTFLNGGYSASQTELNEIGEAAIVGNAFQQFAVTTCVTPGATAPSWCANNKAVIKSASAAYTATLQTLDAAVQTQDASATAIDADIAALAHDAAVLAQLQASANADAAKSGRKALDITTIINIVTEAIPVVLQVYTEVQQLLSAGATVTTIGGYLTTAQAADTAIQAW